VSIGRLARRPQGGLWRNGDYLRLWGAQGISAFGSQITLLALPLAAILTLHASAFEVAGLTAVESAPFLLVGIPAGVWVDRLPRRPMLVLTDIGRAASLVSVPVAYALGALTLPQLYAVALANGVLTVFFTLAYQAYAPSLVAREQLVDANARFEATETVARLAGPATAGGLVALLSAPVAVLADAASFVGSASLIFSIRTPESMTRNAEKRSAFWSEMREGGQFALRDEYVRWVLAITAVLNVGFNAAWAILLVYGVRSLDISAGILGLLLSCGEVGGVLAAFVVSRLTLRAGPGPVIIGSCALFGPSLLFIAAAPKAMPVPFLVVGWAIVSFASVVFNATTVGLRQARVPQRLQGRVVGFNLTIVWGVSPFGSLLGGALAASVGLRTAMGVGAIVASAAIIPALLSPLRRLRQMPPHAESALPVPDWSS
jgi:MFS family permease